MRSLALILLASCSATEVGNTLLPDEFTYGRGRGEHIRYEGESETTYGAFTWHLPSIDDGGPSREDRNRIRSESLIIDEPVVVEEETPTDIMASGGTLRADWRHAAAFGGIMLILLIILLVKLRRSNGWH